jgi:hypothetical protein
MGKTWIVIQRLAHVPLVSLGDFILLLEKLGYFYEKDAYLIVGIK